MKKDIQAINEAYDSIHNKGTSLQSGAMKNMTKSEIAQDKLADHLQAYGFIDIDVFDDLFEKMYDGADEMSYDDKLEIVGNHFGMELKIDETRQSIVLVAYKDFN